jgi:hypothetical protein
MDKTSQRATCWQGLLGRLLTRGGVDGGFCIFGDAEGSHGSVRSRWLGSFQHNSLWLSLHTFCSLLSFGTLAAVPFLFYT